MLRAAARGWMSRHDRQIYASGFKLRSVFFLFEANIVANSGDNWTSNAVSLEISPLSSEIYNRSILLGVYT